ncbi:MAG: bifunctional diaminohydroxyphosphoribosylaminopyrimidine deaminase/5-amino-6-(5-phosphoribosylamino)uracil reductase RibD [Myxococcota bacterium]
MSAPNRASSARDERMMRRALRAAARGDGLTHPNPSVGAVVYRGEQILGIGTTRPPGGPHAEIVAMDRARRRHGAAALRGATLAVTLEPCNFVGRTGACTEAIAAAGIGRVVAGCRDPHARVSGRGFARLRRAGIAVTTGVLDGECRAQHRGFISVCERGRPFVTLKLAATLDGRIAVASGESRWITSAASRAAVHRLRLAHDAVMVGSATAIADDPELSARRGDRILRWPVRVLVDGGLRVPARARLFAEGPGAGGSGLSERAPGRAATGVPETWIVCREGVRGIASARKRAARVFETPRVESGHVDLTQAMRSLAEAGLTTILVEGGGRLAAALLQADLVDEVHWFLAPRLIGDDGRPALGAMGIRRLRDALRIDEIAVRRCGSDLHLTGCVSREGKSSLAGRSTRKRRTKART